MKKILSIVSILCPLLMVVVFASGCFFSASPNESKYWFSSYSKTFVAYDDLANNNEGNLDVAGTYWDMTVKNNCNITITLSAYYEGAAAGSMWMSVVFKKNDQIVTPGRNGGYYSFNNLNLKKGDKLSIHAKWENHAATSETGFKFALFTITDQDGTYIVNDIQDDKLESVPLS